jgi:hypothetical protein
LALSPEQSDALIREVDDAVREDQIFSFWTRYGKLVAGLVGLSLAGFGGWLLWQNHQTSTALANSEQFAAMLKAAQSARLDDASYAALTKAGGGYKTQAELVKAALAAGKDDIPGAIASYEAIIADSGAPQPMRDLALVRRTALKFDSMKPQEIVDALGALAVPGNGWYGSAGEMVAIAYLNMDKKKEAGELFAGISRDPVVTESIRARAGQMAGMLGVAPDAIGSVSDREAARVDGE